MASGVAAARLETGTGSRLSLKRGNGARPRLLLAEDQDPVRIVTAAMLNSMGCDVESVIHGEDALRCASASAFDVIVLDIEMPVMDGITAARSIRRLGGAVSATPIMALSAFLADAMQSASWSETFDIALPKPANKNELHAAVRAALDFHPRHGHGAASEPLPLVCPNLLAELGAGLSQDLLQELLAVARRDIESCAGQLGHLGRTAIRGADQVYIQKLVALGRTFAAPRLAREAEALLRGHAAQHRPVGLESLIATARATCDALRAG